MAEHNPEESYTLFVIQDPEWRDRRSFESALFPTPHATDNSWIPLNGKNVEGKQNNRDLTTCTGGIFVDPTAPDNEKLLLVASIAPQFSEITRPNPYILNFVRTSTFWEVDTALLNESELTLFRGRDWGTSLVREKDGSPTGWQILNRVIFRAGPVSLNFRLTDNSRAKIKLVKSGTITFEWAPCATNWFPYTTPSYAEVAGCPKTR